MAENCYERLGKYAADISSAAALVYIIASSLDVKNGISISGTKMLEGALYALGKHLDDISDDISTLTTSIQSE